MRGLTTVAATCLVLVAGCSTDDGSPSADASSTAGSSPGGSAPTSTADAGPSATAYTDRQLATALPTTRSELHGVTVTDRCRTLTTGCPPDGPPGWAFVTGSNSGPGSVDLAVSVKGRWDAAVWRTAMQSCPRGAYLEPLRSTPEAGEGAYQPGEKGRSERRPWTVSTWTGFTCRKEFVFLWPGGEHSEPTVSTSAHLNNGQHLLRVEGRTLAETKALAMEYLARLNEGAEPPL